MSLSLNVLNHLGLNLYSNVPAVLSEAVANAWDADAEHVDVQIDPEEDKIEIVDDGHGMD
jgi:DNA mismatch repair ATPase MutL